jgi:hypothetical protein
MKTLWLMLFLTGCAAPGTYVPPYTIGVGFFGAQVNVGLGGYTVPAKVVVLPSVSAPVVLVPPDAPVKSGTVAVVTASGETTNVPVKVDPVVTDPVLAVPK